MIQMELRIQAMLIHPQPPPDYPAGELDGVARILNHWLHVVHMSAQELPYFKNGQRIMDIRAGDTLVAQLSYLIGSNGVEQSIAFAHSAEQTLDTLLKNGVPAWIEVCNDLPVPYTAVRIPAITHMLELVWAKDSNHTTWLLHQASEEDLLTAEKLKI